MSERTDTLLNFSAAVVGTLLVCAFELEAAKNKRKIKLTTVERRGGEHQLNNEITGLKSMAACIDCSQEKMGQ